MTDEWLPIDQAARQARVRVETIRVWRHRGKVRGVGRGAGALVNLMDVLDAERAWRQRVSEPSERMGA